LCCKLFTLNNLRAQNWWRRRESNPSEPFLGTDTQKDTLLTQELQNPSSSSTLRDLCAAPNEGQEDESETVSRQKTDGIAVEFQVTGRSQGDRETEATRDDLRWIMSVWPGLRHDVRAHILEIVKMLVP